MPNNKDKYDISDDPEFAILNTVARKFSLQCALQS